jgi:predicted  nucleic acid-binding Zn-ribbon protein
LAATSPDEVRALVALVELDGGIAKREASVACALAVLERTRGDLARVAPALQTDRDSLRRLEEAGPALSELETLRRAVRSKERRAAMLMRQAERRQRDALAASADLREGCSHLAEHRRALTGRISGPALESYETALRLRRQPAAIGTRGAVCWGCFRRLPAALTAAFRARRRLTPCPHCSRLLYDPTWLEAR